MPIFIVEADDAVRASLAWLLEGDGFTAVTDATPLGFLSRVRRSGCRPGCVIADARLPLINGLELQRILRAMGCHWPVIITTAGPEVTEAVEAIKGGAVDYMEKPTYARTLLSRVREVARRFDRAEITAGANHAKPDRFRSAPWLVPPERQAAGLDSTDRATIMKRALPSPAGSTDRFGPMVNAT